MAKDASTIRHEIELTRERMGDTVEALGYKADVPARMKDGVQERVEAAKGTISDMVENVKASVSGASSAAAETGRGSASALAGATGKVRESVGNLNDQVGNQLQDAGERLHNADVPGNARRAVNAVQENPIGLGLAALAVGFLTGSLLPISDVERERLHPIRERIVDQAQAATSDLVEAGKAVVMETAQTAVASALSSAQSHGHDVVDAAKARAAHN